MLSIGDNGKVLVNVSDIMHVKPESGFYMLLVLVNSLYPYLVSTF
jgi:hypothetical protein